MKYIYILYLNIASMLTCYGDEIYLWTSPEDAFNIYHSIEEANVNPDSVRALNLEGQGIDAIPKEIEKFINVEYLNLSSNNIVLTMEDCEILSKLVELKALLLRSNQIENFSGKKIKMLPKSLKVLGLGMNKINTFSLKDCEFQQLELLSIMANPLEKIDDFGSPMKKLKELWCMGLKMDKLSLDFSEWSSLRWLNFSGAPLEEVSIKYPNSIVDVMFDRTKLKNISDNREECANLKFLSLNGKNIIK